MKMKTVYILSHMIKRFLNRPDTWTSEANTITAQGNPVASTSLFAHSWTLHGMLRLVEPDYSEREAVFHELYKTRKIPGNGDSVNMSCNSLWDVIALLSKTKTRLLNEENT